MPDDYTFHNVISANFDDRKLRKFPKGFQSLFGNPEAGAHSYVVENREGFEYTIEKGEQKLSVMVPRGVKGTLIDPPKSAGRKWTEFQRFFPLAYDEGVITAAETLKRLPGERASAPDNEVTRRDRMLVLAGQEYEEQIGKHMRLAEYLASQSILTGKMPAILGTTKESEIYDFRRNPAHIIEPSTAWPDGDAMLAEVDAGCELIEINGLETPEMFVMGTSMWRFYLSDEKIQKYHDNRRMDLATVSPTLPMPEKFKRFTGPGGFNFRGMLITPEGRELYLFAYPHKFKHPITDVYTHYLPPKDAFLTSSSIRCDRYFGPSELFPNISLDDIWMQERLGIAPGSWPDIPNAPMSDIFDSRMFDFHAYEERKSIVTFISQFAPCYVTTHTDAIVSFVNAIPDP